MPENILDDLILLLTGALVCIISRVIILIKRKKMLYEVWIPLLSLCVLGMIGLSAVAICLAAVFTITT